MSPSVEALDEFRSESNLDVHAAERLNSEKEATGLVGVARFARCNPFIGHRSL